ncbi:MAG: DUF349 domain-containing protein [Nocardioidaceae bacterium]
MTEPDETRPAAPAPIPTPAALAAREHATAEARHRSGGPQQFGRVDDDGTVHVRTRDGERQVGQWPQGDPDAALAFYGKRFDGLEVEVDLLVRRVDAGALSPEDASSAVSKLKQTVTEAQAVGDLDSLIDRLDALAPLIAERRATRRAERAARAVDVTRQKEQIAAEAEQLAAGNDWRGGAIRLRDLLQTWKALPRLDKSTDDALWHRFSTSRTTYSRRRKQHFAELGAKHDDARRAKEQLISEAEALSASTDWGATSGAYRELMTRWKAAGPASKDVDEALWRRFRGAQNVFFEARDAEGSKSASELAANAEVKRGLLEEGEKLLPVTDAKSARNAFRVIAERWDAAGKVPRAEVRDLENRFKAVETTIRDADDDRWRRSNPEVHARASETVRKLESALESLRADLAGAQTTGNPRQVAELQAAIEARQLWLDQARRSQSEFRP